MPKFHYEGRNRSGQLVKGIVIATSESQVAIQLQLEQVIPIRIIRERESQLKNKVLFYKKPSLADLLFFCRQMHSLIKAGVPLNTVVHQMVNILPRGALLSALQSIESQLNAGESLSSGMKGYPRVFPNIIVAMVTAGEMNGRLDEAFLYASEHFELQLTLRRLVRSVLRYPIIVMIAITIAIGILYFFAIPRYAALYARFNAKLPTMTLIVFHMAQYITTHGLLILGILSTIALIIIFMLRNPRIKEKFDRLKFKIPIFGHLLQLIVMENFSKNFALLMKTHVPLLNALSLSAETMTNLYARHKLLLMKKAVEQGEPLTWAADRTGFFTPLVMQMITLGEQTNSLDTALLEASSFYNREIQFNIKKLSDRAEPILLFFIGIIVLLLALSVFLPWWNLVHVIGQGGQPQTQTIP